jgi:predicted dipeptidase
MGTFLGLVAAAGVAGGGRDAASIHHRYDAALRERLVPLLVEVLRFPTVAGASAAHAAQKAWLLRTAKDLGFTARDEETVTEIELPGPPGAPVLGLMVHGDVQPVEERAWSRPPFAGVVDGGFVYGRGAADDKGPLVQALLAMRALGDALPRRTHAVRLLVGTDEESGSSDVKRYLARRLPPDLTLVLDSTFPVIVGEKAWDGLALETDAPYALAPGEARPFEVASLEAGTAPSIVPDRARLVLRWRGPSPAFAPLAARLRTRELPPGTRLELAEEGGTLALTVHGKAAHAGVNLEGGRNALVALAELVDGELPACGAAHLLAFARLAGADLQGRGLALPPPDGLWGGYAVNVATVKPHGGALALFVNLRRPPPWTASQAKRHLAEQVRRFNAARGSGLVPRGGYFMDEPLAFDPRAPIVQRLLAAYDRATGDAPPPTISGGGTYAKRLPHAIAFGMWFPEAPYPGHDVDERIPVADLHRGVHVLIEALADLAASPPIDRPFEAR